MSWHPDRYAQAPPEERYDGEEYQATHGPLADCAECTGTVARVYEDRYGEFTLECKGCGKGYEGDDLERLVVEWNEDAARVAEAQEAGL